MKALGWRLHLPRLGRRWQLPLFPDCRVLKLTRTRTDCNVSIPFTPENSLLLVSAGGLASSLTPRPTNRCYRVAGEKKPEFTECLLCVRCPIHRFKVSISVLKLAELGCNFCSAWCQNLSSSNYIWNRRISFRTNGKDKVKQTRLHTIVVFPNTSYPRRKCYNKEKSGLNCAPPIFVRNEGRSQVEEEPVRIMALFPWTPSLTVIGNLPNKCN